MQDRALPALEVSGLLAPLVQRHCDRTGQYTLPDLAAYENYRHRLAQDPEARENYHFAREHRFIRTEDRLFTKPVAGPYPPGGTA